MFLSDAIPSRLWEYLIATILIILAPGPSVLFTIARAIAWGRVAAIATVIGNAAGMFLISVLVALGLGPILQSSKLFYHGIQWAGGGYLIYLGYAAIAASKSHAEDLQNTDGAKPSFFTSIKNGFWVGALNPVTPRSGSLHSPIPPLTFPPCPNHPHSYNTTMDCVYHLKELET